MKKIVLSLVMFVHVFYIEYTQLVTLQEAFGNVELYQKSIIQYNWNISLLLTVTLIIL